MLVWKPRPLWIRGLCKSLGYNSKTWNVLQKQTDSALSLQPCALRLFVYVCFISKSRIPTSSQFPHAQLMSYSTYRTLDHELAHRSGEYSHQPCKTNQEGSIAVKMSYLALCTFSHSGPGDPYMDDFLEVIIYLLQRGFAVNLPILV